MAGTKVSDLVGARAIAVHLKEVDGSFAPLLSPLGRALVSLLQGPGAPGDDKLADLTLTTRGA